MTEQIDTLREQVAAALAKQWRADSAAKRVDSPEGHCARLADAALSVLPDMDALTADSLTLADAVLAAHRSYGGPNGYVGCHGRSCWPSEFQTAPWPCDLAQKALGLRAALEGDQ